MAFTFPHGCPLRVWPCPPWFGSQGTCVWVVWSASYGELRILRRILFARRSFLAQRNKHLSTCHHTSLGSTVDAPRTLYASHMASASSASLLHRRAWYALGWAPSLADIEPRLVVVVEWPVLISGLRKVPPVQALIACPCSLAISASLTHQPAHSPHKLNRLTFF